MIIYFSGGCEVIINPKIIMSKMWNIKCKGEEKHKWYILWFAFFHWMVYLAPFFY